MAFVARQEHFGGMVAIPVGPPQRFACVAAPSYLALRGTPRTPRELPGHACIGRRFPSGHRYAWEFQLNGEPLAVEVNGPLVFNDDLPMIQAACDGAGMAYVYEAMVREDLAAGRLVSVLEDCAALPGRFFLYYSGRWHLPAVLRALVDFLRV